MKRALVFFLLVVACNKTDSTTSVTSASSPPPPPFTGTLTGDRIMGGKDLAHPFDAWPSAQAKLEAQMGKATLVKKNMYMWGVKDGDSCFYMQVEKQDDGTVGMVQSPMKVTKDLLFNWDDCLLAAGARKEAVEDPNAAGPPTDGKAIGVIELRDGAMKARSKWTKAKVTMKGLYMSTTTMVTNGGSTANVSITAAKADLKNIVSCTMTDINVTQHMPQYTPLTVVGTVDVEDMVTGGGDHLLDVELKDCSITLTAAPARP